MAERFARGGRLLAVGRSPAARSDARHVAVEFVHPVIVGKRALPALGASRAPAASVALLAEPERHRDRVRGGRERRRARLPDDRLRAIAEWQFAPPSDDPFVAPGADRDALPRAVGARARVLRAPRAAHERGHDAGASSFLYPFLDEQETRPRRGARRRRARRCVMKARRGRRAARADADRGRATSWRAAAAALRARLDAGGTLLALGNGGSATDAMDVVADLRAARGWPRARSTSPRTRRSSPRSPTTSASRRSSRAR